MAERFIHEFELDPSPQQARILGIRLELGRQVYNAMLGKARARLNRCKSLHGWKAAMALFKEARRLAKHKDEVGAKALRTEAKQLQATAVHQVLQEERERYAPDSRAKANRLKDPAPVIMTRLRQAHVRDHLDFKSCQAMATRAYQAVDRVRFQRPTRRPDGTWKFPRARFVRYGEARAVDSVSIHWRGDRIEWNSPLHKLQIPVLFDTQDPKGIQAHALAQMQDEDNICESMRVLSRTVRGEERWYVQVTIKGQPAWKAQYQPAHGKSIGIDFGPSQIGICYQAPDGTLRGEKLELAAGLRHDYARIRRLQHYLDRSRRATNPQNYNADGTIKRTPGQRLCWHESRRYQRAKVQLAELWRKYAAKRKTLLGRLANELLTRGTTIKIEALSYKAWQKQWGKSIGRGAPGMLVRLLKQKAALVGGEVLEFPTRHTKFSQLCHGCGEYKKKALSQRTHRCTCGIGPIDRDIYSAFLAYNVDIASKTLDIGVARATFATLQCGAVDVQGQDQAASAPPSVGAPSPGANGDLSGSSADRALSPSEALIDEDIRERLADNPTFQGFKPERIEGPAEAPADPDAGERLTDISTFQDTALAAHDASIAAGTPAQGDAREPQPQGNGRRARRQDNKGPPSATRKGRRSQKAEQLSLFEGHRGPAG
jgi:putative transposase